MKSVLFTKLMLPLGMMLLAGSFIFNHFMAPSNSTDFFDGLLKGIGIGMMTGPLIKQWYIRQQKKDKSLWCNICTKYSYF